MLEKVTRVLWKGAHELKHASPTICAVAACVGVVGTAYFTSKATLKVDRMLDEDIMPEKKDIAKAVAPAVGVAVATIALILTSNVLNKKQQAALLAGYLGAQETLKQYREHVKKIDKTLDGEIMDSIVKDKYGDLKVVKSDIVGDPEVKLFYYAPGELYFEATEADVIAAEYDMNHILNYKGYISVNDFLDDLDITEGQKDSNDDTGWEYDYLSIEFEMPWINFIHRTTTVSDDGLEAIVIDTMEPPIVFGSFADDYH